MSTKSTTVCREAFSVIRNYLMQFDGGKVVLDKNVGTGVATMVLDHQQKRNAVSGNANLLFRCKVVTVLT